MSPRSTIVALVVAAVAIVSVNSSQAADRGHSAAQSAMDAQVLDGAPGVLGEAEDGAGVWHGASGVAVRGGRRPRLAMDRFRIGSLTKPFVASVLLQLQAEHRLNLGSPVSRWLPRGAGSDARRETRRVTVRQLLNHTSGLHDFTAEPAFQRRYFSPRFTRYRYATHSPAALTRTALAHPPDFAPGTDWSYSNTNYVLAGMVIQKVTGHSYAWEIEHRLIRPLRLRGTSLPGTSARIPGPHGHAYSTLSASGRSPGDHGTRAYDVTALNPSLAGASGEMISTTGDLTRFMRALLTGQVLPARQLSEMKHTVPAEGDRYGLGLTERRLSCGTRVWGHEGVIQGSRSVAVTTADGSHTAAFNINGDWAGNTNKLLEAEFCGG
jgi:D-alanyl-D-alanine carboxypeptidase